MQMHIAQPKLRATLYSDRYFFNRTRTIVASWLLNRNLRWFGLIRCNEIVLTQTHWLAIGRSGYVIRTILRHRNRSLITIAFDRLQMNRASIVQREVAIFQWTIHLNLQLCLRAFNCAQIASMFRTSPGVLEDVMDGLLEIAKADGVFHPGEARVMERIAEIFGFSPNVYRRIRASHFVDSSDPYVILGVSYEAGEDEIMHTYRLLVKENHPDSLIGRGVPPEFVRLATDKLAAINTAYEAVRRERDIR